MLPLIEPPKLAVESKTIWFNLFMGAVTVLQAVTGAGIIPEPYGQVLTIVGNVILRFFTSQPITLMSKEA